jgi:hypothetical protein
MRASFVGVLCGLFIAAVSAVADENAEELKRLEGRYERTVTNAAGTPFRVVKEIAGNQESVTTFDDVGNVVQAHTVEFKVEKRGPVRVFSFYNRLWTAGPLKGQTELATSSYLYRLDGDVFSEISGLMEGDKGPPRINYWRRMKDGK